MQARSAMNRQDGAGATYVYVQTNVQMSARNRAGHNAVYESRELDS